MDIEYEPQFRASTPQLLFTGTYESAPVSGHQHYDLSHDGRSLLMIERGTPEGLDEVRVVVNWLEEWAHP